MDLHYDSELVHSGSKHIADVRSTLNEPMLQSEFCFDKLLTCWQPNSDQLQ